MKKLVLISLFALIALTGCDNLDIEPGVPECLVKTIREFNKQLVCESEASVEASVEEYTFQGKTVYVLSEGNCNPDSAAEVIDSDCNTLGYLGGYPGNK